MCRPQGWTGRLFHVLPLNSVAQVVDAFLSRHATPPARPPDRPTDHVKSASLETEMTLRQSYLETHCLWMHSKQKQRTTERHHFFTIH